MIFFASTVWSSKFQIIGQNKNKTVFKSLHKLNDHKVVLSVKCTKNHSQFNDPLITWYWIVRNNNDFFHLCENGMISFSKETIHSFSSSFRKIQCDHGGFLFNDSSNSFFMDNVLWSKLWSLIGLLLLMQVLPWNEVFFSILNNNNCILYLANITTASRKL